MKSIELKPTWAFAVRVYIEVLKNPKAPRESIDAAQNELMRLARIVDEKLKETTS